MSAHASTRVALDPVLVHDVGMARQFDTIRYERTGRLLRITLNRPDKGNALTDRMLEELCEACDAALKEEDLAGIILRGAGERVFCAGADLGNMTAAEGAGAFIQYEASGLFPQLFLRMERLPIPILAAVNGHCMAGGLGLMMACDLAIAKAGVKMGTPEVERGLFPYMISALILRAVGRRRAFEMMLLGETFSSEQAAEWGLVNKTVPADAFDAAIETWASKLSSLSPAVLRLGKKGLAEQQGMPLEGAFAFLQGLLTVNRTLDDAREGIQAFFEKREPLFKGR